MEKSLSDLGKRVIQQSVCTPEAVASRFGLDKEKTRNFQKKLGEMLHFTNVKGSKV